MRREGWGYPNVCVADTSTTEERRGLKLRDSGSRAGMEVLQVTAAINNIHSKLEGSLDGVGREEEKGMGTKEGAGRSSLTGNTFH